MRGYYQSSTPKGIKICHADHGLTREHISFLDQVLIANRGDGSVFKVVVEIPQGLPDLPAALYGPSAGDETVTECMVRYGRRPGRQELTRFIDLPERRTRHMAVIGRLKSGKSKVITAYGASVVSPRHVGDPNLSEADRLESEKFWSEHALSYDSVMDALLNSGHYSHLYSKVLFVELPKSKEFFTA